MKIFTKTNYIVFAFIMLVVCTPQKSNAALLGLGGNFCSKLPTIEEKILLQVDDFQAKREAGKPVLSMKLEEAWNADKEQLALDRQAADERRAAQLEALMKNAETDAEKKAVTSFGARANKAVKDLRTAIDKATLAYQTSVIDLRDERLAGIDESITAYKIKIQTSFATIKTDCEHSNNTEKNLKAEIETLRAGLKKNQELYDAKIETIDTFAEVRATAISKAETSYSKEMKAAENALRKALNQ